MILRYPKTMRFIIQVLFLASTVTQSLVKGQQCDCASTVPKCKPLPTQNVGSGTETSCVKVPRSDCPCCLTCAGQLHDTCDPESQPCDIYKGLICDSTTQLCTKEVRPCQYEGGLKEPGESFHSNDCQKQCTCSLQGELLCQPTVCPSGLEIRGSSLTNNPFCQEVVQHFPDPSSSNASPINFCCVKLVCATLSNDEISHAENDKIDNNNDSSLKHTSSSLSSAKEDEHEFIHSVSNIENSNNFPSNLPRDVPLDHGTKEFEQPLFHIPMNDDIPLDFGDYEHEQTEFHIPERLSSQHEDKGGVIRFPTSGSSNNFHINNDDNLEIGNHEDIDDGFNLEVLQVTQNSVQVRFPGITGGNLMYVEERLYRMKSRGGLGNSAHHHSSVHLDHAHTQTPWENAIILEGNKIYTLTALKPGTLYRLRWQAPDKQYPDIMVSTQARDEKPPKVIMTSKSFDSVTLSFDHFAPKGYKHGYVAMFKQVDGGKINPWEHQEQSEGDLQRSRPGDPPSIRIEGLLPNTEYMARIAIYSDYSLRSFGKTSSVIEFKTENGCVYKGSSYAVGPFNIGCELSCKCNSNGQVSCDDRCRAPFHPIGTTSGDPLCVEQPVEGDGCCVTIICSNHAPGSDGSDEHGPCNNIKCGPNAECRHEVFRTGAHTETICVCKDGYTGDADNLEIGCAAHINSFPEDLSHQLGHTSSEINKREGCKVNNETYAVGAEWFDGCEYRCTCDEKKETLCQPRCEILPEEISAGCELKPDPKDSCCKVMYCPDPSSVGHDTKQVGLSFDGCVHKKASYTKGERFYDGCEKQCQCIGNGDIVCLARCSPTTKPSPGQNCYTLADASDPCCNVTVCDDPVLDPAQNVLKEGIKSMTRPSRILNHDDNEDEVGMPIEGTSYTGLKIGQFTGYHYGVAGILYALNESTLFIKDFAYTGGGPDAFFVVGTKTERPSPNGIMLTFPFDGKHYEYDDPNAPVLGRFEAGQPQKVLLHLPKNLRVSDLKWLSVWCRAYTVNFGEVIWPDDIVPDVTEDDDAFTNTISTSDTRCRHKGKGYEIGQDFYDDCNAFCMCVADSQGAPELICNPIQCPSSFGLDVINPFCLRWDEHADFVPKPPMCCPPIPVCLSDGSCDYKGHKFNNYDNIPMNLTGCEQRCYCEDGEVLCREACYELADKPPTYLRCSSQVAAKIPKDDRPCCLVWGCPALPELSPTPVPLTYERLNATSVRIRVRVPRVLDGRTGFFKVYHSAGLESHQDPNKWPVKDITPEDGMFRVNDNDQTEFILSELLPEKQYFFKTTVNVRDDNIESGYQILKSDIINLQPQSAEPPEPMAIKIDIQLEVQQLTSTSAMIKWRFFASHEKQYIDGAQIRYVELQDGRAASGVPGTTPFIHRDTNFFLLEDLQPDTEYRVDVYLIPVPLAEKELASDDVLTFRTKAKIPDPYDFKIKLKADLRCQRLVDVSWSGVPIPHQQFVNVYHILYKEEEDVNAIPDSVFKVAKIDSMRATRIGYLRPGTRYSMWLEAYLSNGKIMKSNVETVQTKMSDEPQSTECKRFEQRMAAMQRQPGEDSSNKNFYNGMLIASIIAAVALLALIIVLALYLKRTTTYKAIISGGKKSEYAFSNKAFTTDNVRRGKSSVPKSRTISENGSNSFELNGVHTQNMYPPESNGNSIHKVDLYPENKSTHSPIPPPVQPRPPPEGHPGSRNGTN